MRDESITLVFLTKGKVAVIDAVDAPRVLPYHWFASESESGRWYARSALGDYKTGAYVYLHRYLMGAQPGVLIDHRNGDGLNNRRSNLREASTSQNNVNARLKSNNTSGYRGIYLDRRRGHWHARITFRGKTIHLGSHQTDIEAAMAYDVAAREIHGEFASLNFPD